MQDRHPRASQDTSDRADDRAALSDDELAAELAVDLPDREAMSTMGHGFGHGFAGADFDNFAMPINEASAANVSSTSSVAAADADQVVIINQVSDD